MCYIVCILCQRRDQISTCKDNKNITSYFTKPTCKICHLTSTDRIAIAKHNSTKQEDLFNGMYAIRDTQAINKAYYKRQAQINHAHNLTHLQ